MAITSADDLFTSEPLMQECTLASGKTVLLKAMSPKAMQAMQQKYANHPRVKAGDGTFLACMGLIRCIVHPETHEPLLADVDLARIEQDMTSRDFQALLIAFNDLHGFADVVEELDPVKKPETDSETDISGIDSPTSSASAPTSSLNVWPTRTSVVGETSSCSKTGGKTIEQPF